MFLADTMGLKAVLEMIRAIAKRAGERYWSPAPLIAALAKQQSSFAAWQAARAVAA
jgi:hypothetical protein